MNIDWQHHGRTIQSDIGLQANDLIIHLYIGRLSIMYTRKDREPAPVEHIIDDPRWSDEDEEYQTWCTCGWTADGDKGGIWYGINQHQKETGAVLRP